MVDRRNRFDQLSNGRTFRNCEVVQEAEEVMNWRAAGRAHNVEEICCLIRVNDNSEGRKKTDRDSGMWMNYGDGWSGRVVVSDGSLERRKVGSAGWACFYGKGNRNTCEHAIGIIAKLRS